MGGLGQHRALACPGFDAELISRKEDEMRNIYDMKHVKSVTAWAVVDATTKEFVGKVIANWSDNPCGSVCTLDFHLFDPERHGLKYPGLHRKYGKAGGGGYCKLSAAFSDAVDQYVKEGDTAHYGVGSAGETAMREWLKGHGLVAYEVL